MTAEFTGKERDAETGLDYFGARYFSGAQGRFTSPDWSATPQPIPYADLGDPQTLNLYAYVRNNPLRFTDSDGHCPICIAWGEFAASPAGQQVITKADAIRAALVLGGAAVLGTTWNGIAKGANALADAVNATGVSNISPSSPGPDLIIRSENAQAQQESSRGQALNDAKRDARVPTSQQPEKQANVPVTDQSGKQVVVNGKPQTSREYTHTTGSGTTVVIQDHKQGHSFPDGGKVGPHINVRPQGDTRNGTVPSTQPHYPYKKPGEN